MKYTVFIALLFGANIITAQLDSLGCLGAVGDVKYSILTPDDFQSVNGACWVLMDGRNISSTKLGAFGYQELPDARGIFIRGYDNRMDDDTKRMDVDRSFGDPVGEFQKDGLRQHTITYQKPAGPNLVAACGNCAGVMHSGFRNATTTVGNAGDTRPQNITMFTYIRIN